MWWFWNAPGLAAAVVAMLLVACGGGADRGGIEAQQGTKTSRARVLALAPVAPEEAARQLMDFAEARYPQYFPSRQPTQSLPPFAYRHYPETGAYLGVVVTTGMGYEPMGVYVMGGPFGSEPQFVGPLASFITPVAPGGIVPMPRVSSVGSGNYAMAVTADGAVWAWGTSPLSNLTDIPPEQRTVWNPVQVALPGTAVGVDTTGGNEALLRPDGRLLTRGVDADGLLGHGSQMPRVVHEFADVTLIDRVAHLALGGAYVAVRDDGSVWRWGPNQGEGRQPAWERAERIGAIDDAIQAVNGGVGVLILRRDGTVWFWGRDERGVSAGAVAQGSRSGPDAVQVPGLNSIVALASGVGYVLAVRSDGTVWSWGFNLGNRLGYATGTLYQVTVAQIPGLADVAAVAAGGMNGVALHRDGTVSVWGAAGVTCLDSTTPIIAPSRLPGVDGVAAVYGAATGFFMAHADGTLWACGQNALGVLGLGLNTSEVRRPTQVPGIRLW
ncbi:MAG: hypothetical protein AMXMBFR78_25170 [Rubrivivax sp.]